jgi:hypothetical protein
MALPVIGAGLAATALYSLYQNWKTPSATAQPATETQPKSIGFANFTNHIPHTFHQDDQPTTFFKKTYLNKKRDVK